MCMFTDKPFRDYRPISVGVTAAELRAALLAMKKAIPILTTSSEDPRDCQLVHFNINPEIHAPKGSRGRLGQALRDMRVEMIAH